MDPVEAIGRAQAARLVDEDGGEVELEVAPGLSPAEIERLGAEVGVPLPRELRELLAYTAGIEGTALEGIDFTGRSLSYEDQDVFPSGLPIAADGFGNFWALDLTPDEADTAPVFFACHDPPVIVFQSHDLGEFLEQTFLKFVPPHESLVDDVREEGVFHIWHENPDTLNHAAALTADEDLRAFAEELGDRFVFFDLRSPEIGAGFSWGRYGVGTEVRRHGYERLFAIAEPERRPGLLRRLFT
jgi:cell wall assembly regulator SMI1